MLSSAGGAERLLACQCLCLCQIVITLVIRARAPNSQVVSTPEDIEDGEERSVDCEEDIEELDKAEEERLCNLQEDGDDIKPNG